MDVDNFGGGGGLIGQFPLEQWFYEMPVCTRWWTAATVAMSVLVQCHVITPFQLFYSFRAVFVKNQVGDLSLAAERQHSAGNLLTAAHSSGDSFPLSSTSVPSPSTFSSMSSSFNGTRDYLRSPRAGQRHISRGCFSTRHRPSSFYRRFSLCPSSVVRYQAPWSTSGLAVIRKRG